ncbi:hypothetical protein [Paenibacillus sp. J22TS3]|uniref:hypothetical protein n=1 Tax=Paenibacillus sp. J22TS3 TaxID=2807192 RepID=UPI001B286EAF|nr:hypothetical protein [Paenibacillus sp. J22TS3]GIP21065.1 hypothetical protein J22TS3_13400 [Paenibacillus sp. J22TS3]
MKKFVAGVVVGAALFAGTSVFADSIKGLIGMKVSGTYEVVKNGKKIGDAAVIGEKAYVPVRAISDAAGIPLTVKGKTITMAEPASAEKVYTKEELEILNEITTLQNSVLSLNNDIKYSEAYEIAPLQKSIEEEQAKTDKIPGRIETLQAKVKERQDYVDGLRKSVTEKQAKIDALKAQLNK